MPAEYNIGFDKKWGGLCILLKKPLYLYANLASNGQENTENPALFWLRKTPARIGARHRAKVRESFGLSAVECSRPNLHPPIAPKPATSSSAPDRLARPASSLYPVSEITRTGFHERRLESVRSE